MSDNHVIGEYWDFEHYEKQKKLTQLLKEHTENRKERYGQGTEIDDYEAKKDD